MRLPFGFLNLIVMCAIAMTSCKSRVTESGEKKGSDAPGSAEQSPSGQTTPAPSQGNTEGSGEKADAVKFPANGSIAASHVLRTSGNSISGRTQTGTSTTIPRESSWLKPMGKAFTQVYDIHSDNFAVGTVGAGGTFSYVVYLNSTLGYVNPNTKSLMYCESQMVSQSSQAVAILDCMDALHLSRVSLTSKYANGNPVFDTSGALLYEDGNKVTFPDNIWKSINGRIMYQGDSAYYGNGQIMRTTNGDVFFSDRSKAFDVVQKVLFFDAANGKFAAGAGALAFYRDGSKLAEFGAASVNLYYPGVATPALLTATINTSLGRRTSTITYPKGNVAVTGGKVYREDGSEAPVEVTGGVEAPQVGVVWSAGRAYSNVSISQYSREATFNVLDEYVDLSEMQVGPPQNPVGLLMKATSSRDIEVQWASGGGTTAGFVYRMQEGTAIPTSCSGGTDIGMNMKAIFNSLRPLTSYSIRVCAKNYIGTLSSGVGSTVTTLPAKILKPGESIPPGKYLASDAKNAACVHKLEMRTTGILTLTRSGATIWQAGYAYSPAGSVSFTMNFYQRAYLNTLAGKINWQTPTGSATADVNAAIGLTNHGNIELRSGTGALIWQSNTGSAACL